MPGAIANKVCDFDSILARMRHTIGQCEDYCPMRVKSRKPIKKIAAIRAILQRYGEYEVKEYPHPECSECYLFTITNPKAENLIHCELVYCPGGNWELKKSKYTHSETATWLRAMIYQTIQGRMTASIYQEVQNI